MAKHYALWPSRYSDCTDPEKLNMMPFVDEEVTNLDAYSLARYTRLCYEHLDFAFQKQHSFRQSHHDDSLTTSEDQNQNHRDRGVSSASPPPSTFVVRTRAAVMSDQSPEGDWVDVGGGDSEESHADLFLLCGLGLSLGVFLVIIYAIFRTPSNAGNEERGLKSAMMGLHETMAATAMVEAQKQQQAAAAAAEEARRRSSSRDAAAAAAAARARAVLQAQGSSGGSRTALSHSSRQPSRDSAGSNSTANVVENYNYEMAAGATPVHGRGQFRPPLQKNQSLYQHPEDERITKLRQLNSLLGRSMDRSMDLERGAGTRASMPEAATAISGHGHQQQQLQQQQQHQQQQRLHHQRELLRQQTMPR